MFSLYIVSIHSLSPGGCVPCAAVGAVVGSGLVNLVRTDNNSSNITRFYERLSKRKGAPKAAVAAASKLLRVVYWIMKERREYRH